MCGQSRLLRDFKSSLKAEMTALPRGLRATGSRCYARPDNPRAGAGAHAQLADDPAKRVPTAARGACTRVGWHPLRLVAAAPLRRPTEVSKGIGYRWCMSVPRGAVLPWAARLGSCGASAACLAVMLALSGPANSQAGSRYYVEPSGSDRNSGGSPSLAWRTVGRVNRASLRPGDVVVFRGGDRFGDAPLIPRSSGSRRARIRYGSFGGGQAILTRGVFLASIAWITIDGLRIRGAEQGIASGTEGSGARHIELLHNTISDVQIGVNSPNAGDSAWRIADNHVTRTGDSGLILEGADFTVVGNRITSTGTDPTIAYGKHGIYAKGARLTMLRNRIEGFATEGISTRFRDAVIAGNVIQKGDGGVGYYADDPAAGTTTIRANRLARVGYGIYIAPEGAAGPSRERVRVERNTIVASDGPAIDAPGGRGRVEAAGNRVRRASPSEYGAPPAQAGHLPDVARSTGGALARFGAAVGALALALALILARRRIHS
jgi:parallel beta helix pectate lyase-like protein